jgi:hypothetical protein
MSEITEALERAFPIYAMGGLSNAMYRADEGEGEGWALDNDDFNLIADAARRWAAQTQKGQGACSQHT